MDDLPVGNPDKVRHIKATYYQAHVPTSDPRDDWRVDFAFIGTCILILIAVALVAATGAVPAR